MLDEDACDVAGVVAVIVIGVTLPMAYVEWCSLRSVGSPVDRMEASVKRKMGKRGYPQLEWRKMNNQSQGNG